MARCKKMGVEGAALASGKPMAYQWHTNGNFWGLDEYLVTTIPKDPYPSLE